MYVGLYAICVLNWNWWLTQDHFLIKHWSQRTNRCSARVVGLEEYSLGLVSRYSTVRSGTLTWREWGLWFGIRWSHACTHIPLCTNTLGTSQCTTRDVCNLQTSVTSVFNTNVYRFGVFIYKCLREPATDIRQFYFQTNRNVHGLSL